MSKQYTCVTCNNKVPAAGMHCYQCAGELLDTPGPRQAIYDSGYRYPTGGSRVTCGQCGRRATRLAAALCGWEVSHWRVVCRACKEGG